MSHDPAAKRGENQRPALQQILLPSPEDNRPVLQHHDPFTVLLMMPHEAMVQEFVSFEHLQRGSHVFLGDLLLCPVLLGVFGLEHGFRFVDLLVGLVGVRLGEVGGFVVESFEHYNYYKINENHSWKLTHSAQ